MTFRERYERTQHVNTKGKGEGKGGEREREKKLETVGQIRSSGLISVIDEGNTIKHHKMIHRFLFLETKKITGHGWGSRGTRLIF